MGQVTIAVSLLGAIALGGSLPREPSRVTAVDLQQYVGRMVTVCGKVVSHDCAHNKDRSTRLNLDEPPWHKSAAVLISETARRSFPPRLEDRYVLANVCATGPVERRGDRYVVRVDGPDQIAVQNAPPPSPFPPDASRPCDSGVEIPQMIREVTPSYTAEAMRAKIQGVVLLEALVVPDGTVPAIRILHGLRPDFGMDDEAIRAVTRWRLQPGTSAGRPVPVVVTVELTFTFK